MLERHATRIEAAANVGIIIVAALAAALLIRQLTAPAQAQPGAAAAPARAAARAPSPGSPMGLTGVDWSRKEQTLVLVLSTSCRFCTNSAEFYRRLATESQRTGKTRLIAVLPQPTADATRYLADLGVAVDEILQAVPSSFGTRGTPTLVLVDKQGTVKPAWTGKLPSTREAEVLSSL